MFEFFLIIYSVVSGHIFASCIQYKYSIKESLQLAILWPVVAVLMILDAVFHV